MSNNWVGKTQEKKSRFDLGQNWARYPAQVDDERIALAEQSLKKKRILKPFSRKKRGMDPWRDIFDWQGGYPFEVARSERVLAFYRDYGFTLERMTTIDGRHGCNEYVFLLPSDRN